MVFAFTLNLTESKIKQFMLSQAKKTKNILLNITFGSCCWKNSLFNYCILTADHSRLRALQGFGPPSENQGFPSCLVFVFVLQVWE